MSLQVWLPLNGSVKNQGINTTATFNTSGISYSSGKLGNAATFSSSYIGINNTPLTGSITDFSICFWMQTSSPSSTQCIYNGRTATGSAVALFVISGVFRFDDGSQHTLSYSVPTSTWEHYCITRNSSTIKLYVNGVLKVSASSTSYSTTATKATIGASSVNTTTGSGNCLTGQLNDYRIYDNCLSAQEVRDIAKGLVMHIPMNNQYSAKYVNMAIYPNYENRTPGTAYTASGWSGSAGTITYYRNGGYNDYPYKIIHTTTAGSGGIYLKDNNSFTLVSGTTYTYSAWIKASANCGLSTYSFNINGTTSSSSNQYIVTGSNWYFTTEWKRYSYTFTCTDTLAGTYGEMSILYTNSVDLYISGFQIEANSTPTPYAKSTLVSTTEVSDVSGYKNNGTITTTTAPSCISGSARYNSCYQFDGSANAIQIPFVAATVNGTFTANFWFYKSEWGSKGYETLLGGPSGFELDSKSSSTNSPYLVAYNWGGGKAAYTLNTWHMVTMVRTSSDTKFYLDGTLVITGTTGTIPSGNYFLGAWNSSSQQNFKGKMSDFRLYTTALSQADITDLYNAPIKIANNGTLITNGEIVE